MISGVVNAKFEATIRLSVSSLQGQIHEIEAILDTGFSGSLTLPSVIIRSLGLPWRTRGSVMLANGAVDQCDIYAATVMWDGGLRNILVEEADTEPLVGMALLRDHVLSVQIVPGGTVTIAALP